MKLSHRFGEMGRAVWNLVRWVVLATITGAAVGFLTGLFGMAISVVTEFRLAHSLMLLGLPAAGLVIVFLYRIFGLADDTGTNRVILAIREQKDIPIAVAPLIVIATVLTHAFGGSSGREGAALQFGGSLGNFAARKLKFDASSTEIMVMTGMSAAFAALFGTPLAATILPMEFVSVGVLYYAALVPCVISAFTAHAVAVRMNVQRLQIPYEVTDVPNLYSSAFLKVVLLGVIFAAVGIGFIICLHTSGQYLKKWFSNQYIRILVGGTAVAALALLLGTQDYIGLGSNVIHACFDGNAVWYAAVLKVLFVCLTLESGYKGGEIVPSFFIGAVVGCSLSRIIGLPADICTACGMCSVFCAVTNSPISALCVAFELFGFDGMGYFAISVAVSYMMSGYYSLYGAQKIMYSKTETKFINRTTGG
ncbi:MAG: chloride channel protein [Lachnospiraceae bacterium]|nr:chloride channel protein [Lachnospiraceae bacterium]